MKRKIAECRYSITPITVSDDFVRDPATWLTSQAKEHELDALLAHADDGVIWGRIAGETLVLSSSTFPHVSPPLRTLTLQQVRLFGQNAELLVWRDGDCVWQARLLDDRDEDRQGWCFNEEQLLWGDQIEDENLGFTLVTEGQEGLRHAVPLPIKDLDLEVPLNEERNRWRYVRLGVRQYLERDEEDGAVTIVQGRLTGLRAGHGEEGINE